MAYHFIRAVANALGQKIDRVEPTFPQALGAYCWPGNIRELRHVIESTIVLMDDNVMRFDSLPEKTQRAVQRQLPGKQASMHFASLNFDDIQRQALCQALRQFDGNISQMAKALGIGRNTTYAKLKKFKLL
ncbi:helix-turn-helix domain-containing protein [uncultured Desulfobacter sp.]|uniref:helix-turn-helix domain-containing protein n=1 Tax=uncultured Desulfobacter sp. TaxID=240139 RepID=UPI0029F5720A|nr:helix-turn-helix domain-containing protein [uncultured Desulfobacter sp.]